MATIHKGECFCGAVQVEVSGEPEAMGYCHCRSCRSWSGGPVNAFTLWKADVVRVSAGAENIATFQKTNLSQRQYCRECGGHLMTNHPRIGLVDVFAATIPTLKFTASVHVNYAETVLPMQDGLPKIKGFPAVIADHEIAILCDLGGGHQVAHFNAEKREILDHLIERGFVEQDDREPSAKLKLTAQAQQLLAERGAGLNEA